MALEIFEQQAMRSAVFTIAANFTDPDVYFVGGGVVERPPTSATGSSAARRRSRPVPSSSTSPSSRLVPDLDMAGARGSAVAAAKWVQER